MATEGNHVCVLCGRTFAQNNAFSIHQCNCKKTKILLSGALNQAKELWRSKKWQQIEVNNLAGSSCHTDVHSDTKDIDSTLIPSHNNEVCVYF
jgi:hypothetical protein